MTTLKMNKLRWQAARRLAAELAQRDFDNNLLKTAASHMKFDPQTDLEDWLYRLVRLGDAFSSSNQTGRYRHELYEACRRLSPRPESGEEWALVLSWAARLFTYYESNRSEARQISNVSGLRLPKPPQEYRPKVSKAVDEAAVLDIPEPPEKTSELAKLFMRRLEKKQGGDED